MVESTVKVSPSGAGWIVAGDTNLEPLLFLSGGKAEAQAHLLARMLASGGASVSVAVHDRLNRLVGRRQYSAAAQGAAARVPELLRPEEGMTP
jgi:hypothetical protein